ncbi:MAG TPA: hypothetical protein VFJ58_12290 [Armatimonadota bacterium]|nr:hypothetical protein [Armatimonadota bacterium]
MPSSFFQIPRRSHLRNRSWQVCQEPYRSGPGERHAAPRDPAAAAQTPVREQRAAPRDAARGCVVIGPSGENGATGATQQHLDDELALETLAAVFSPYHFHRVFRGMVGYGIRVGRLYNVPGQQGMGFASRSFDATTGGFAPGSDGYGGLRRV